MIAPYTHLLDYRNAELQEAVAKGEQMAKDASFIPPLETFPELAVPLTSGKAYGDYLMLDTTDGSVGPYKIAIAAFQPTYSADDPRAWREECDSPTKPLKEYLDDLKTQLEQLERVAYIDGSEHTVLYPPEAEDTAEVCEGICFPSTTDFPLTITPEGEIYLQSSWVA